MSNQLREAALSYAARGWCVFPCRPKSKAPLTQHGFKDATLNADQIKKWWEQSPSANVAVDCGRSKIIVIDVDGDEGLKTLTDLRVEYDLGYETLTSQTPGKVKNGQHVGAGLHLIYSMPVDAAIGNQKIGPGLETRGAGGYILLPRSIHPDHPNGPGYAFDDENASIRELPVAWLYILKHIGKTSSKMPQPACYEVQATYDMNSPYARAAFDDELAKLHATPDGDRNNQLNRSAFALGQLVGANVLS